MSGYRNPIHSNVVGGRISDSSALDPRGQSGSSSGPGYQLVQQPFLPSHKYKPPSMQPVTFDLLGSSGGQGISARLLCGDLSVVVPLMKNPSDRVFINRPDVKQISFRIIWPGYSVADVSKPFTIPTADGMITRAQLAQQVARRILNFMEQAVALPCFQAKFQIGTQIHFDNVYLVSLQNIYDHCWQATLLIQ